MKSIKISVILLISIIFISACSKKSDYEAPYVTFKNSVGETLNSSQTINVSHNVTYRLIANVGYSNTSQNRLRYEWKIDNNPFEQYSVFDGLTITTLGTYNNLATQNATLDINFSGNIESGSTVIIRVRDLYSLSEDITFKVE